MDFSTSFFIYLDLCKSVPQVLTTSTILTDGDKLLQADLRISPGHVAAVAAAAAAAARARVVRVTSLFCPHPQRER